MVTLQRVVVPGYAEAVRKEQVLRENAFLDGNELVLGVEVRPLNLRAVILLERAMNGHFVACRFDNGNEALAHAIQVLYFCRPDFRAPTSARVSWGRALAESIRRQQFIRSLLRRHTKPEIITGVQEWLNDAFLDCPSGSSDNISSPSHAGKIAYIVDLFAEAGLPFSYDEILSMPLGRLWQNWRLAARRCRGLPLVNPSDEIVTNWLAKQEEAAYVHRN